MKATSDYIIILSLWLSLGTYLHFNLPFVLVFILSTRILLFLEIIKFKTLTCLQLLSESKQYPLLQI